MQPLALVIKLEHVTAKTNNLTLLLRPLVRMSRLIISSNLIALLEIWGCVADLVHLANVLELGNLFAAGRRVSSVGFRCRPVQLQLLLGRLIEEFSGEGIGALQAFSWHMMILEVDEASSLEPMKNGIGCVFALRGGSFEEETKVDELDGSAE